eukprot:TRINITY_DN17690_c0_g1_i2.p1 TRINITY_DN17690_c0_g1~~TRINITY_DN17690_c0_g1_i2.p1  ORF type:complete len:129 (-),score=20.05 TRINITY_DN17690_c0_g1_i2:262-648(-)
MAKLGPAVVPNSSDPVVTEAEIAYDITDKFTADKRGAFLLKTSLVAALKDNRCEGFYELMGKFLEGAEVGASPKTGNDMPLLETPHPTPSFAIQIRGIRKASPKIVLRTLKTQQLPAALKGAKEVAVI